jgi:hypothetical protein
VKRRRHLEVGLRHSEDGAGRSGDGVPVLACGGLLGFIEEGVDPAPNSFAWHGVRDDTE